MVPPPDKEMVIPLPTGEHEVIDILPVDMAMQTLGVVSCPSGNPTGHLLHLELVPDKWVTNMSNGHLPSKWVWVSYQMQLWSAIHYGLGVVPVTIPALRLALAMTAFRSLPLLGFNRHLRWGW